jgi:hypothetical protein
MYKTEMQYYRKAFFMAMIMGVILFMPFVIIDGGYFIYYGDYNAQQIPFYTLCNQAIKNGSFMWNWQTDLGANFIGSRSIHSEARSSGLQCRSPQSLQSILWHRS